MVRVKESSIDPIRKDRFYIWTWVPKNYKRRTKKWVYQKHLTGVPYFTRKHVKITLTYIYGVDVLAYIHIISGSKLIEQGVYHISDINPYPKDSTKFWFKGRLVKARKWVIPPEYKLDKHRRRHFIVMMFNTLRKHGKKEFDRKYKTKLIGQRKGISSHYIHKKRLQIRNTLIPYLQEIAREREIDIQQAYDQLSSFGKLPSFMVQK